MGRVAGFHFWIVAVWYRNGSSVLGGTKGRENARIVLEHIDMDAFAIVMTLQDGVRRVSRKLDWNDDASRLDAQTPKLSGTSCISVLLESA
jgi:hypothetical protein